TASMFSTHTLVAYPIIAKFGLTKHRAVAISVGGTILTDTAVLIILAIISSASSGELDWSFWVRLITSLCFFSLIMFYVLPKVTRWFLKKLDTEKTSQYILILSVVFFSAFLAEVAGVEHIIGAFVAGLVLNRLIPHNSILMNRIDFIGNALFIPSFLIFVGMVVDYRALFQGSWPLIIALVLTSFAIFSKWLAAWVTQLIYRMTSIERRVVFGLSSSHAAATLAIIMVGFQDKILDINVVNGTILLILITCMVASFVTENAGKDLLRYLSDTSEDEDLESKLRNKHLLVAMNKLEGNEKLLEFAIQVSDQKVINPISVVSVLPNTRQAEQIIHKSRKNLEEIVKHFSGYETKINTVATIDLNISSGISRVAMELVADAVVVNDSSKSNILKLLVGDDREHLLQTCDKTIYFCQIEKPAVDYRKILVLASEYAELENYFLSWAERILRYSNELKLPIEAYMKQNTYDRFVRVGLVNKIHASSENKLLNDVEEFFHISKVNNDDLIVLVHARTGAVSYNSEAEALYHKINKVYDQNDKIIIFPGQEMDPMFKNFEDVSGSPIGVGVDTISRIGKEVGSIFKKEDKEDKEENEGKEL
ncbi:MAG: cation:proton antiporter, partial [Flavobacteriia bacterium]|nr:cation:proton antiporter [Flavobacteriia bacterium]